MKNKLLKRGNVPDIFEIRIIIEYIKFQISLSFLLQLLCECGNVCVCVCVNRPQPKLIKEFSFLLFLLLFWILVMKWVSIRFHIESINKNAGSSSISPYRIILFISSLCVRPPLARFNLVYFYSPIFLKAFHDVVH